MKSELLPAKMRFKLVQSTGKTPRKAVDAVQHLIVITANRPRADLWRTLPHGAFLSRLRSANARRKDAVPMARAGLPGNAGATVSLGFIDPGASAFARNTYARRMLADALAGDPTAVGLLVAGFAADEQAAIAEAFALAATAAIVRMPHRKSKPPRRARFRALHLLGLTSRIETRRLMAAAEGAGLARWLAALPPNVLTATSYREAIAELAQQCGWDFAFHDMDTLRELGAGAFVAVAQASPNAGPGICRLRYRPDDDSAAASPAVALVGKGIMFDTGGINLKPFTGMRHMHEDMQGSGVALGTLLALTRIGYERPVDCWLAITENHIGAAAYKPHDVVTACNGTTIEVVHTDAEGRMVLADTLALAAREKPSVIIDYATLTGSCVGALSERYSGVFTNRPGWQQALVDNGVSSGERVWSFPNDADFDSDLDSQTADILQCSPDADADHILAARFLQRFVPEDIPWLHMDLSAHKRKRGLGHVPSGLTGFGVRYTLDLLQRPGFGLPNS